LFWDTSFSGEVGERRLAADGRRLADRRPERARLRATDEDGGLRAIIRAHGGEVQDLPADEVCHIDVNTPEDYERMVREWNRDTVCAATDGSAPQNYWISSIQKTCNARNHINNETILELGAGRSAKMGNNESADKPGSVVGSHSSAMFVAEHL